MKWSVYNGANFYEQTIVVNVKYTYNYRFTKLLIFKLGNDLEREKNRINYVNIRGFCNVLDYIGM